MPVSKDLEIVAFGHLTGMDTLKKPTNFGIPSRATGDLVPLIDGDRLCGVCRRGVWLRAARGLGVGLRRGARLVGVVERRFGTDLGVLVDVEWLQTDSSRVHLHPPLRQSCQL